MLAALDREHMKGKVETRYHCAWQIKPPPRADNIKIYVKMKAANLVDGEFQVNA